MSHGGMGSSLLDYFSVFTEVYMGISMPKMYMYVCVYVCVSDGLILT